MSTNGECHWCKHNPYSCDKTNCDFKSLAFNKEAILIRLKEESKKINTYKQQIVSGKMTQEEGEKIFADILDVIEGIKIMSAVAQKEFGATEDELKAAMEKSEVSKVSLAMKALQMKRNRGGKQHGT